MPNERNQKSLDLTEVERLKMENLSLKRFALDTQMRQVQGEYESLIKSIEQKHPGWHWKEGVGFVADSDMSQEL